MISARVCRNAGSFHASGAIAISRRLPVAGKIRPGIKVLTQTAAKVPGLAAKYAEGLAAGASFDDIAAALKAVKGAPAYPLTPRNVPYFSVRQGDFATPGAAESIMERYAEVRHGDPERRLYAFPVIFPSDDLDLVFRESFEAWKASELLRWSEQDPDTGVLQCMRRAEIAPDKSARRRWGGRQTEAERPCNPNDCTLFAKGDCKHVASLAFWIPGVTGTGVIDLTFTSVYASMGVVETLEMVRAGLGRISGLHNGRPIFWISKSRERVSRMNWETGKPEKTEQWIIRLEASGLDMVAVLAGTGAMTALPAPEAAKVPALEEPIPPIADEASTEPDPEPITTTKTSTDPHVRELRAQLAALRDTLGWEDADLREWVDGQGYASEAPTRDAACLADMVDKLAASAAAKSKREETPAEDLELVADEEVPF